MFQTDRRFTSGDINTRLIQTGDIIMDTRDVPGGRTGFLYCDGSAVSRVTYAALNALYSSQGYPFGAGDGVTTFNIPDCQGQSPLGTGTGPGLTPRALGDTGGEENHVLIVTELAQHTHLQNSHNHTQNAHNHTITDPGHNHLQNSHNHTQDAHTHTQDQHDHPITDPGHSHSINTYTAVGTSNTVAAGNAVLFNSAGGNPATTAITVNLVTAINQNTTATNQATTATNQSNTTGITVDNTTATNQATTATNQDTGSNVGHNTMHPFICLNFWVKF